MDLKRQVFNDFNNALKTWDIDISMEIIKKFEKYFELLVFYNSKINLTSIIEKKDVFIKHFLDSISSYQIIKYNNQKIIDIGTGGGFPGLPLKIVFPKLLISFVDSSKKKMYVLKEICEKLEVSNCEFISNNIEKIGREEKYREKFDISLTRAIANISTILEYSIPLLKVNGISIIYKGPNVENEVDNSYNALKVLDSKINKIHEFVLPFTNEHRKLVVVEKTGKIGEKYPRKEGVPKKRPL
jgi:16S rRNA (guanine527-N7)-methyltransferase